MDKQLADLIRGYDQLMRKRMRLGRPPLPNLIGVGPPRSGTSTLHRVIANHPDVFMSPIKEVNFFGHKSKITRSNGISLEEYRNYFIGVTSESIVGEISPIYLAQKGAIEQIASTLQNARIIVTLREPLARAISQYHHHASRHGYTNINDYFSTAVEIWEAGSDVTFDWFNPAKNLRQSLYSDAISRLFRYFPECRVKILFYDDLQANPTGYFDQVYKFLELEPRHAEIPHLASTRTRLPTSLGNSVRARLEQIFANDTKRLRNIVPRTPW